MSTGYSGTPLIKKLGIKPGFRMALIQAPQDYLTLLGELPPNVQIDDQLVQRDYDVVHAFFIDIAVLQAQFQALKAAIHVNGMIWVSWPKKSSKVPTTLSDGVVRETGLNSGLVDVKVAAIDATWSGLKFVYRKADRY